MRSGKRQYKEKNTVVIMDNEQEIRTITEVIRLRRKLEEEVLSPERKVRDQLNVIDSDISNCELKLDQLRTDRKLKSSELNKFLVSYLHFLVHEVIPFFLNLEIFKRIRDCTEDI